MLFLCTNPNLAITVVDQEMLIMKQFVKSCSCLIPCGGSNGTSTSFPCIHHPSIISSVSQIPREPAGIWEMKQSPCRLPLIDNWKIPRSQPSCELEAVAWFHYSGSGENRGDASKEQRELLAKWEAHWNMMISLFLHLVKMCTTVGKTQRCQS